jgi:hypothetical protein
MILVSQLPSLGCPTHPEPRRACPEPVGSTKDSPSRFLSEEGGSMSMGDNYLTGADVNNMLHVLKGGGCVK